ncbi:bpX6 domain-containing protein [Duganella sp.]|uniref:bpX6 domain-containing protein n=1 Tax=Duganella sp. TaxID=1904440 RepID=UPI0031D95A14
MQPKIRRPLYEAMQHIHALWFDLEIIGEAAARCRVLGHWTPGSRLYQVHGGLLLILGTPRHAHCANMNGLPLCEENGVLSSAPLAQDERGATPPSCIWLVQGAHAHLISLAHVPCIDPSTWLALDMLPLVMPLGPPQTGLHDMGTQPEPAVPLRAVFGDKVPPASARREAMLRKLQHPTRHHSHALQGAVAALGVLGLLAGASMGLLGWGAGLLGWGRSTDKGLRPDQQGRVSAARNSAGLSPLAKRLSALAARLAVLSGAAKVVGWRQALYLRKMLELLEQGNMQEGLRHAIPLDGKPADRPAMGTPRPRASLEIGAHDGISVGIGLNVQLREHLRVTYRRTFERLDREGKIDEAAYVLAELLKCHAEAVDYLERKERLTQAAQLAETLVLPAETAVRLWLLAGNTERVMHLARLTQTFGAAVTLLENKKNPQAAAMRVWWAQDLAQRGRLCEAADAIWPLENQREQALTWLLEAEHAGGMLGTRALLRKLTLMPDSLAASEAYVLQLLSDHSVHGPQRRWQLATELLGLSTHSTATRRIATELLRPLLAERMAGQNQLDKQALNKLLDLSGNAALRVDLPQFKLEAGRAALALAARSERLCLHQQERGLMTIHDAHRLPDGHYLLALGEAGVLRIDRHGRQVMQFPVPATRLVLAEGGQRALALVQRNAMWRVSRIDLISRRVSDWIVQPLRFWAAQYDGLLWNAVIDNRLVALDTSKDQLAVSWQIADLPGEICAMADDGKLQTLLLANPNELQQWRYHLPSRRLMQRDIFPQPERVWQLLPHSERDVPMALYLHQADSTAAIMHIHMGSGTAPFKLPLRSTAAAPAVSVSGAMLMIHDYANDEQLVCQAFDLRSSRVLAQVRLDFPRLARSVVSGGHILLFDQAGRIVDISCEDSTIHTLTL